MWHDEQNISISILVSPVHIMMSQWQSHSKGREGVFDSKTNLDGR